MSVILPSNSRTKSVMDITATARGTSITEVVVENDAASLTLYVDSLGPGQCIDVVVKEVGNNSKNRKTVAEFSRVTNLIQVPETIIVPANAKLEVIASHTGAAVFEIHGRSVSGARLTDTKSVSVVIDDPEKAFRKEVLSSLGHIATLLQLILNHQRIITGVESENEGDF